MFKQKKEPELDINYRGEEAISYLENYNLERVGSGSFGRVYKLISKTNHNDLGAAKFIFIDRKNNSKDKKTIAREIKYLKLLTETDDPRALNLVTFRDSLLLKVLIKKRKDYLIVKEAVVITMMWCESDLQKYIDFLKEPVYIISDNTLKIIMWQLFNAIQYIHEKGIIHRDLKPSNILLKKKQNISDIRIADFGLSIDRKCGKTYNLDSIGTPYYMAPEIINNKRYGCECDLWSLGIIMYELITGKVPFENIIHNELIFNYNNNWKSNSTYLSFDSNVKEIVENLLLVNPKKRWSLDKVLNSKWFKTFDIGLINK